MQRAELARRTGVSIDTLRYYEAEGVIPAPPRRGNGYRDYGERYVDLLDFVVAARGLGLPLQQIRAMVGGFRSAGTTPEDVRDVVRARLAEIDEARRTLDELRASLAVLLEVPDEHVVELIATLGAAAD
jgi:MerR family transcriptional regulator, copper efflux regulator